MSQPNELTKKGLGYTPKTVDDIDDLTFDEDDDVLEADFVEVAEKRERPEPVHANVYVEPRRTDDAMDEDLNSVPSERKEAPFFKIMTGVLTLVTICAVAFGGYTYVTSRNQVDEIANLTQEKKDLEDKLSEANAEVATKEAEFSESSQTIEDLKRQLEDLQKKYDKLNSTNKKLDKKVEEYENEKSELSSMISASLNRSAYSYKSTYNELRETGDIGARVCFDATLLQDSTGTGQELLTVSFENKAVTISYMANKIGIEPTSNTRYRFYGTYEGKGERDRPTILIDFLEAI